MSNHKNSYSSLHDQNTWSFNVSRDVFFNATGNLINKYIDQLQIKIGDYKTVIQYGDPKHQFGNFRFMVMFVPEDEKSNSPKFAGYGNDTQSCLDTFEQSMQKVINNLAAEQRVKKEADRLSQLYDEKYKRKT